MLKLSSKQELDILKYASALGLPPVTLNINGSRSSGIEKIVHRLMNKISPNRTIIRLSGQDFYLKIKTNYYTNNGISRVFYFPGQDFIKEKEESNASGLKLYKDWEQIFITVKYWLDEVKTELDANREINSLLAVPFFKKFEFEEASPQFTSSEKIVIKNSINSLKMGIPIELDLDDYKLNLINRKLDDLIIKVDSLNKFDFRSALLGVLINLTSSVIYDQSGKFWNLVKNSFPLFLGSK